MGTHTGRVAVVTGAAQGIGQSVARMLAERGATVVGLDILDLDETEAQVRAAGSDWLGMRCDVGSREDVARAGAAIDDAFQRCDILVNNAAVFPHCHPLDLDQQTWDRTIAVNLTGPLILTRPWLR